MKKILFIILSIILLFALTACHSEEEIAQKNNWLEVGKTAMQEHLNTKYNIKPSLETVLVLTKDYKYDYSPAITADYIPIVVANFSIDGEKYNICADVSDEDNIVCYDNYQKEEIKDTIIKYIKNTTNKEQFANDIVVYDEFKYSSYVFDYFDYEDNEDLVHRYIDNFDDVISNTRKSKEDEEFTYVRIHLFYEKIDKLDFTNEDIEKFKETSDTMIVNFKNNNAFMHDFPSTKTIEYYIPTITEYIRVGNNIKMFTDEPSVEHFNEDNIITKNGIMFYHKDGLSDINAIEKDGQHYYENGKYYCYIPKSSIKNYVAEIGHCILLKNDTEEKIATTFYDISFQDGIEEEYYMFDNTLRYDDTFDYWCIIETAIE